MKEVSFKKYIDTIPEAMDPTFIGFKSSSEKIYPSFSHVTSLSSSQEQLPKSYCYLNSSQELFLILKGNENKIISKLTSSLFENVAKFKALNFLMFNLGIEKDTLGISDLTEYSMYDQKNNALRSMVHIISAFFSGINEVKTYPYDYFLKTDSEQARRLVELSFDILKEESFLGTVNDPLKGSYYVENRARVIAQETFELLKKYEAQGLVDFKRFSEMKSWMALGAKAKRDEIYQMDKNISGVNNFINFEEKLDEKLLKDHFGAIFSLEKIRTKIQYSALSASIYCFGELKDYLNELTEVTNVYNSLGVKVEVSENSNTEVKSDFFTIIGNEDLKFDSQVVSTEVLTSKNLDLVIKELNKNKRFTSSL